MGMAVAWVAVQFLTGAWSLWRLRSINDRAKVVGNGLEHRSLPSGPGLESA
jgi:hypothetical protein